MRNPFRSENAAYHFLLLTVLAFGIVAVASVAGGPVAALVAWVVVSALAVWLYAGHRTRPRRETLAHVGPPDERRIVVVAPLAASPLHRLANDVDVEQAEAQRRADTVVERLRAPHVRVAPAVGEDALTAVDDALHTFGGDEILVLSGDDSLVDRLRDRYTLPVTPIDA